MSDGRKNKRKIVLIVIIAVLLVCLGGCVWYVNDYYRASPEVDEYFRESSGSGGPADVTITEIDDGLFLDGPGTDAALIFYPGAKVEYTAYVPLMYRLAENGADVFLIKMPCNLAILGIDKADDIADEYEYEKWYLGGHSLGGAMAAVYAADQLEDGDLRLDGLVLMAAYPTKSLQSADMSVLTIYGSEDGVLNMEKIAEGRKLMPSVSAADGSTEAAAGTEASAGGTEKASDKAVRAVTETVIEGGNHAQFGCYGKQKGDGRASISAEEQWNRTADAVLEMMGLK